MIFNIDYFLLKIINLEILRNRKPLVDITSVSEKLLNCGTTVRLGVCTSDPEPHN
jgi:hypothetical protein